MTELIKVGETENATVTSLELTEQINLFRRRTIKTAKLLRHDNLLSKIKIELEASKMMEIGLLNISETSYKDSQGKDQPMYILSHTTAMMLAASEVVQVRILVGNWIDKMKATIQSQIPQSFSEALMLAANQAKQIEQQELQLQEASNTIEENKHKVVFADAVAGSQNLILIRQFAKQLSSNGFEIGQNRLFAWFRDNGYLMGNNEPYQNYVAQGLFEVIERTVGDRDSTITVRTTKITGKGQTYFTEKIVS